jgi:hypothetical protein
VSDKPNESNEANAPASDPNAMTVEAVEAKLAKQGQAFRPEAVANALGISGKVVRAYLRQTFARPIEAKGTTWVLNPNEAAQTIVHFKTRTNAANAVDKIDL